MTNELVIEAAKMVYDHRYEKIPYKGIALIELFEEALLFSFVFNEQRYVMNVIRDQVILTNKGKVKIKSLLLMPVNKSLYESFLNDECTVLELFKEVDIASVMRIGWINGRIYPLIPVENFEDIQDMITVPDLYYSGKIKLQLADDTIENQLIVALQNWQISANKVLQQYAYKDIPLEAFPSSLRSVIISHKAYDEPVMIYLKTVIQMEKLEVNADLFYTTNNLITLFDLSTALLEYILKKREAGEEKMNIEKHIESMNHQEQQALREELIYLMNEDAVLLMDHPMKRFILPKNAVISEGVDVVEDLMDVLERVDNGTDFYVSALLILMNIFTSEQLIGISHLEQASFYERFKTAGYLDEITVNIKCAY